VAQDNESQTWNAYRNQYWPAQYIVDRNGNIVFQHDGEGQYELMDRTIQRLLSASARDSAREPKPLAQHSASDKTPG
jgi:hypothetical protein